MIPNRRHLTALVATALTLASLSLAAAGPPSLNAELSLGFDSNPAQRRDGPALGFIQAAFELLQPLAYGLSLEGALWLRDYAGHNDNGRLDLTAAWSGMIGKTQLDLWGGDGWYRDQLVRADERNESALGAVASRALSARVDLAIIGERRWLAYRHRVLPWAGRPGGLSLGNGPGAAQAGGCAFGSSLDGGSGADHGGQNAGGRGSACRFTPQRRADRLDLLAADITWLIDPRTRVTLGLERAWRHSSIPLDAYDQQGLRLALGFDPHQRLGLTAELGWSRLDYMHAPQQLERIDHQRWAGLGVSYWQGDGTLFCGIDLLDSRSTIALEAFTQWVGRCGYQHAF